MAGLVLLCALSLSLSLSRSLSYSLASAFILDYGIWEAWFCTLWGVLVGKRIDRRYLTVVVELWGWE